MRSPDRTRPSGLQELGPRPGAQELPRHAGEVVAALAEIAAIQEQRRWWRHLRRPRPTEAQLVHEATLEMTALVGHVVTAAGRAPGRSAPSTAEACALLEESAVRTAVWREIAAVLHAL